MESDNSITFVGHNEDQPTNTAWSHFRVTEDGNTAICKICSFSTSSSTKELNTHLASQHNMKVLEESTTNQEKPSTSTATNQTPSSSNQKMDDDFHEILGKGNTLDEMYSRMIAIDDFTFGVLATSETMRFLISTSGYTDLPETAEEVRNIVMDFSTIIRNHVRESLKTLKSAGAMFSISCDEWMSTSNQRYAYKRQIVKRYMSVKVHSGKEFWSLGLIRIDGLAVEDCRNLLKERLHQFGLSLDTDIVALVTDGQNVMLEAGKLAATVEHQLCMARGVHLAVCDVLYKKKEDVASNAENRNHRAHAEDSDDDDSDDDTDSEDLHHPESSLMVEYEDFPTRPQDFTDDHNIREIIKRVREVILFFKAPSNENEIILEKYVNDILNEELSLQLNSRKRWTSLLKMLESFLHLKIPIQKASQNLNNPVTITEADFDMITDLVNTLRPVKLVVDSLYHPDANLCTADDAIQFLMKRLTELKTTLSMKMNTSLLHRLRERRRPELSGLLNYLQNPNISEGIYNLPLELGLLFSAPSKTVLLNEMVKLARNMYSIEAQSSSDRADVKKQGEGQQELALNVQEESLMKVETDITEAIENEMNLFESGTANRGPYLEKIYNSLMTIPPASIDNERAFHAAGYDGRKLSNRLNDTSIDNIFMLRSHLKNIKQ